MTNSKVVLSYITNDVRRFKTFVANRVQQIKDNTISDLWYYISNRENLADSASRELNGAQVNSIDCWFQLVWQDTKYLPSGDVSVELPNDDPELKKDITCYSTLFSEEVTIKAENIISSWLKLKRVIALGFFYKQKLLESFKPSKKPSPEIHRICKEKLIGLREIQIAEMEIIRSVQSRYFVKEFTLLNKKKKLEVNKRIFKLDPHVDTKYVFRVGGRIRKSLVQQEIQHPMLLPKDCRMTNLIVSWFHDPFAHAGGGITINQFRMFGFWVIRSNIVFRSIISKCVRCKHLRGRLQQQKMADLPRDRISEEAPFTSCGFDIFGLFVV